MAWQRLSDAAAGDAGVLGQLATAAAGIRIARESAAFVVDDHQRASLRWFLVTMFAPAGSRAIDVVVEIAQNAAAAGGHRPEHRDRQARRKAVAIGPIIGEKVVGQRDRDLASAELDAEEAPEADVGFMFEVVEPVGLAC